MLDSSEFSCSFNFTGTLCTSRDGIYGSLKEAIPCGSMPFKEAFQRQTLPSQNKQFGYHNFVLPKRNDITVPIHVMGFYTEISFNSVLDICSVKCGYLKLNCDCPIILIQDIFNFPHLKISTLSLLDVLN